MSIAERVENLLKSDFTFDAVMESDGSIVIIGIKAGARAGSMASTHGGFAGKSLSQKVCDDLDLAIEQWKTSGEVQGSPEEQFDDGFANGIAHALGILWGTSAQHQHEDAVHRWDQRPDEGQS